MWDQDLVAIWKEVFHVGDTVIHYRVRFKGGAEKYRAEELIRIDEEYAVFKNKNTPEQQIKLAIKNIIAIDKVETTRLFRGEKHPMRER